jgi:hypothetical protein
MDCISRNNQAYVEDTSSFQGLIASWFLFLTLSYSPFPYIASHNPDNSNLISIKNCCSTKVIDRTTSIQCMSQPNRPLPYWNTKCFVQIHLIRNVSAHRHTKAESISPYLCRQRRKRVHSLCDMCNEPCRTDETQTWLDKSQTSTISKTERVKRRSRPGQWLPAFQHSNWFLGSASIHLIKQQPASQSFQGTVSYLYLSQCSTLISTAQHMSRISASIHFLSESTTYHYAANVITHKWHST